ncbi:MBL fold metallo-hydrolase, partial [Bacillus sp. SS-TM]
MADHLGSYCPHSINVRSNGPYLSPISLWCSWLILGQKTKIFFSGDSGYAPHFKEIGDKYGPFDLTLMECGQYESQTTSD